MGAVVVLEWKFSPPDYFGSRIETIRDDYTMIIADGKAEVEIDYAVYMGNPSIRNTLHDKLNSQFLGVQLSSRKAYDLSSPNMTRVEHDDGRRDYILEVEPASIKLTGHPITLRYYDKDGNVVADRQTEEKKRFTDLVIKHHKDEVLKSLLKSHGASVSDPDDELVHLYEIRDALSRKFWDERGVISVLGINKAKLKRFGALCNEEPLRQGRHRGKKYGALRDASTDELSEVRGIALDMIKAYLEYIDAHSASP